MRRLIDLIAIIVLVILGLSFTMLNTAVVQLNYYFAVASLPLSLLLVIMLFVGAILGALSTFGILLRQRAELARLRRRFKVEHKVLTERAKLPVGAIRPSR